MYLGKYNWNYITIVVSGLCIIVSYPEYTYPTVLSQKTVINGILAPASKLRNHLLVGGLEHVLFVHIILGIVTTSQTYNNPFLSCLIHFCGAAGAGGCRGCG
jgi:hypothetical protein